MFDIIFSPFKRSRSRASRSSHSSRGYDHISSSSSQVTITPANHAQAHAHSHTNLNDIDVEAQSHQPPPSRSIVSGTVVYSTGGVEGRNETRDNVTPTGNHDDSGGGANDDQRVSLSQIEDNRPMGSFGRLRDEDSQQEREQGQWRGAREEASSDGSPEQMSEEEGSGNEANARGEVVRVDPPQYLQNWSWTWDWRQTQTEYQSYPSHPQQQQQPPQYHLPFPPHVPYALPSEPQQQQQARTALRLQTNIHSNQSHNTATSTSASNTSTSFSSSVSGSTSATSVPTQQQSLAEYTTHHPNYPFRTPLPGPPPQQSGNHITQDFIDHWTSHHPRVKQLSPIFEVSPTPTSSIPPASTTSIRGTPGGHGTRANTPTPRSSSGWSSARESQRSEYQSLRQAGSDILLADNGGVGEGGEDVAETGGLRYSNATGATTGTSPNASPNTSPSPRSGSGSPSPNESGGSGGTNAGTLGSSRRVSQIVVPPGGWVGNDNVPNTGTGISMPTPVSSSSTSGPGLNPPGLGTGQQVVSSPISATSLVSSNQTLYYTPISAVSGGTFGTPNLGGGVPSGVSPGGPGNSTMIVTPTIAVTPTVATPEIPRPAFLTRQINRSISQTSSISNSSVGGMLRPTVGGGGGNIVSGSATGGIGPGPGVQRHSQSSAAAPSVRSISIPISTNVNNPNSNAARPETSGSMATSRPTTAHSQSPLSGGELQPSPIIRPPLNILRRSTGSGSGSGSGSKSWRSSIGRVLGFGIGVGGSSSGGEKNASGQEESYEDAEEGVGGYGNDYRDESYGTATDSGYGYVEGGSAPGEEASGGYGYGYGYGDGDGVGFGVGERGSETIRYSDYYRRGLQYGHHPTVSGGELGRRSGGISVIRVDEETEGYVDPPPVPTPPPTIPTQSLPHSPTQIRILPPTPPPIATVPRHTSSHPDSFITRRWSRDNVMRQSITQFFQLRAKKQETTKPLIFFGSVFGLEDGDLTPAFWAFWLGFVCPVVWLVGGWHFTSQGEQPARMSAWEFYFSVMGRCGRKRNMMRSREVREGVDGKGKGKDVPQWVAEKQSTDDGRARLNDPKRSLRGISFGYPFVARPQTGQPADEEPGWVRRVISKPNRLWDELYGVKLKEVRGRPENARRMFDPWIQRCRYAFCWACVVLALGLCAGSTLLIVFNTRRL